MTVIPELRDELRGALERHQTVMAPQPQPRRRRHKAGLFAASAVAVLFGGTAAAAALGVFNGPRYAPGAPKIVAVEFPADLQAKYPALRGEVLPTPPEIRRLFSADDPRFDVDHARAITTAHGPGYVFPASEGGVCLAAPDPDPRAGFGVACTSAEHLADHGARLAFVDEAGAGTVTALVAQGATPHVTSTSGPPREVRAVDGVVSVDIAPDERLTIDK